MRGGGAVQGSKMVLGASGDLHEVIISANLCVCQICSLGAIEGRKWGFPIET